MDKPPSEDESDIHLLIDSGTESITESPIAEDDSERSEGTTVEKEYSKIDIKCEHLLDKAFSIDEDVLAPPLEPIHLQNQPNTASISNIPFNGSDSFTLEDKFLTDMPVEDDDGIVEEDITFEENTIKEINPCDDDHNCAAIENPDIVVTSAAEDESIDNLSESICKNLEIQMGSGDSPSIIPFFDEYTTRDNSWSDDEINLVAGGDIPKSIEKDKLSTNETNISSYTEETNISGYASLKNYSLSSILRQPSQSDISEYDSDESNKRKVSFPSDETALVRYREPEDDFPWKICRQVPAEKILQLYINSCKKHQTIVLDTIKMQIMEIKNNTNHSAYLNLSSVKITAEVNETLEDLLKVTNFHTLILYGCKFTPETMSEFLNMLEYYESVRHIEVAMNFDDEDDWKCFCSACSNINVLESISFKGTFIKEQYMRYLLNAVKNNPNITTLKFDGCMLVRLPNFYLVENLMANTTIRELYLPSTGLYTKEAEVLGRFLQKNFHLKVLDISNNQIGDRGFDALAKGLLKQTVPGYGLSVLVVFNNQLTEKSGPVISNIIAECKNLHTLNIGYNNLTDEVLKHISVGLTISKSIEGLGLQCTLLTCKGIDALTKAIQENESLQKINLKGNKAIQVKGVEKLCQALTNSKIIKIEIDETNRSCNDPDSYMQMVKKMNEICNVNKNKSFLDTNDEVTTMSQLISRKVSLSCEPRYTLPDTSTSFQVGSSSSSSPAPSPISSPAPKNRFQITRVKDATNTTKKTHVSTGSSQKPKTRFRVIRVLPSPEEDVPLGKFSNLRGSVSSNDSTDSLHLDNDSD